MTARRIALGVLAVMALIVAGRPERAEPPAVTVDPQRLRIEAQSQVEAGNPIMVKILDVDPNVEIEFTIDGGYGPRRFTKVPSGPVVEFEVPAANGPGSGRILMIATQRGRVGVATFDVFPGEAAAPVASFLGPGSISTGGEQGAVVVAIPIDAFGNPVASGTPVYFQAIRPNAVIEEYRSVTDGLIGTQVITAGSVAGRTRIAVRTDRAAGSELELRETAGTPRVFDLTVVGPLPLANGRSTVTVRTSKLVDVHDNTLPDGVLVYLDLSGATGYRRLHSVTIDGSAQFAVEAPTEPGPVRAVGVTAGAVSNPLDIQFVPAVIDVPASAVDTTDGRLVRVGPVRTVDNVLVPDATRAMIRASGLKEVLELRSGSGSVLVPASVEGSLSVTVLGFEVIVP